VNAIVGKEALVVLQNLGLGALQYRVPVRCDLEILHKFCCVFALTNGAAGYNQAEMLAVRNAAEERQFASSPVTPPFTYGRFASARVLAALPGLSAALSGESALSAPSQPVR